VEWEAVNTEKGSGTVMCFKKVLWSGTDIRWLGCVFHTVLFVTLSRCCWPVTEVQKRRERGGGGGGKLGVQDRGRVVAQALKNAKYAV
jgi:hypothetical protein